MRRRLATCCLLLAGCSTRKPAAPAVAPDAAVPAPPLQDPFSAEIDGVERTFRFGHAVVTDETVDVYLQTTDTKCPKTFPMDGHTVWFQIPPRPDCGGGHRAARRRASGHLELTKDDRLVSIGGKGDFDVALCEPGALSR